ncbi:OmpR family two-component system bacitracin resistance sensor histidine kinase BceS [Oikeobacillus pervagus]|uniref:histidine kinase n=1 Tax=Oikeobacillus pervagus TaxID=1325931 RepID=A0AAJ1WGQ5_9BACI|nr:sensor histidine kinase [Oikeobacillus pervagus]MDQ0215357.1 OmpR family two-component system bacitracin resistance sensor histidine kinase BceS [Oikeobacillus pervagus]
MVWKFVKERGSWISFYISLQLLFVFISYVDSAIPLKSILYIVFLSTIAFMIFLIARYQKETKFYKSIEEWDTDLDLTSISDANSPFEKIIEDRIIKQTKQLKREVSQNFTFLEREKDELLSWIHEVKTPLTAMHLIIDRIEDELLKKQLRREWLRIHFLLDQQLHQKRILFIKNDLYIEKVDLKPLIFNEIKTLQPWCIQKGIGFNIDLKVEEVLSDGKWLAYIIRQLLTNAVKYSESADIIIKTYQKEDQTRLEVIDFGRGIDPKDLPRIFDKGFTSTAKHQDNKATGIGLYLAKNAAKPLLIQITVQSTPGKGTTFSLTFPAKNEFHHISGM